MAKRASITEMDLTKFRLYLLILFVIYLLYVTAGGLIFHAIEHTTELKYRDNARKWHIRWIENHTCVTQEEFYDAVRKILDDSDHGVIVLGENETYAPNWDIKSSFFFATTVVTTIGYGHISPTTTSGQIFCVSYALLGIPLSAVFFSFVGAAFLRITRKYNRYCNFLPDNPRLNFLLRSIVSILPGTAMFLVLPAVLFTFMETWTYWEAFYYSFITLSTIGFGDYVVGQKPEAEYEVWYRILVTLWIIMGLSWLSVVLSFITNELKSNFKYDREVHSPDSAVTESSIDPTAKAEKDKEKEKEKTDDNSTIPAN